MVEPWPVASRLAGFLPWMAMEVVLLPFSRLLPGAPSLHAQRLHRLPWKAREEVRVQMLHLPLTAVGEARVQMLRLPLTAVAEARVQMLCLTLMVLAFSEYFDEQAPHLMQARLDGQ